MGLPIVAIIGRPNVGKSTLFNRLIGKSKAVVDDEPGITRDRNYAQTDWSGKEFVVVDTGGIVLEPKEKLAISVSKQAEIAAQEADLVLFLIDKNITEEDIRIAKRLKRGGMQMILAVNKVDSDRDESDASEAWSLGVGEPISISSLNGRGVGDLLDLLISRLPEKGKGDSLHSEIRVAVVGKPNVGKSSFVNRLLGQEKLVVDDVPGTTRDSIDTPFSYNNKKWVLTDTAGLLHKLEGIDYYSSLRTVATIKRSDIILILVDAVEGFNQQDKRIAAMAVDFYKGLVIAVNKWDLVPAVSGTAHEYEMAIKKSAPFLDFAPVITISSLTGQRVRAVLDLLESVADERKKRITTAEFNDTLMNAIEKQPPPTVKGMRANILYATQESANPPVFIFFCRNEKLIPNSYKRYLSNVIRGEFGFEGVSFKMIFRGSHR